MHTSWSRFCTDNHQAMARNNKLSHMVEGVLRDLILRK